MSQSYLVGGSSDVASCCQYCHVFDILQVYVCMCNTDMAWHKALMLVAMLITGCLQMTSMYGQEAQLSPTDRAMRRVN